MEKKLEVMARTTGKSPLFCPVKKGNGARWSLRKWHSAFGLVALFVEKVPQGKEFRKRPTVIFNDKRRALLHIEPLGRVMAKGRPHVWQNP